MTDYERNLNGLPAWKQGLINYAAKIDRDSATRRLRSLGGQVPYKHKGNHDFDILNGEAVFTKVLGTRDELPDDYDYTRPEVLSSVAGIEIPEGYNRFQNHCDHPARVMTKIQFAGFAQDSVFYKPENAAKNAATEDLPVQIRGVFDDTAIGQDFAFGSLLVALPPPCEEGDQRGTSGARDPNVGKSRLILQPESDGQDVGDHLAAWLSDNTFGGQHLDAANLTPTDLAFLEYGERLTDTIISCSLSLVAHFVNEINKSGNKTLGMLSNAQKGRLNLTGTRNLTAAVSTDLEELDEATIAALEQEIEALAVSYGLRPRLAGEMPNKTERDLRQKMMKMCLADFIGEEPKLSPEAHFTRERESVFNRMRRQHMQRTHAGLLDSIRTHNQWVVGKVIRAGKENKKYYGLMI